jgi:hypothetical protein
LKPFAVTARMRSSEGWRVLRRAMFEGRRPEPAGRFVRVAALVSAATMLGYAGQKIYMACVGKIGMPGKYAPEYVQERFHHPALDQAGNAALGLLVVLVVLATVMRWGARLPRLPLLAALAVASVMFSLGLAIDLHRTGLDPTDPTWWALDVVAALVQIGAWFVVVGSYAARSRRPPADPVSPRRPG